VLFNNSDGSNNTATGENALGNNHTGSNNAPLGGFVGGELACGSNNIHIGMQVCFRRRYHLHRHFNPSLKTDSSEEHVLVSGNGGRLLKNIFEKVKNSLASL